MRKTIWHTEYQRAVLVFIFLFGVCPTTSIAKSLESQCEACHAEQVADWRQSHHFHAMEPATPSSALGNFNNHTQNLADENVVFSHEGSALFIEMLNLDGKRQRFEVAYTFGYEPLQQYMFDAGNGKYQFFPYAWDSRPSAQGGQRWFVLHPEQGPADEFHWSNMGQNWNQMCADCHSTQYRKNFDPDSGVYHSEYSAVNVSCEACHGDSDAHLSWANGDTAIADKGFAQYIGAQSPLFRVDTDGLMKSIATLRPSAQISVCASCHSRRAALDDLAAPGAYYDSYQPALITAELYHADGQIWDEDYVWGSFLQSKMHEAGVTCTNCHNPHSGKLKLEGNQVCTQCHDTKKYDATSHHGHAPSSKGGFCVDCHMPETTYMQIDPRRDHSYTIPRPDLTASLGVPNACTGCHDTKSARWAQSQIQQWHPQGIIGSEHFAEAFHAADTGAAGADQKLTKIAQDAAYPDIIRASALQRMVATPGQNAIVAIVRAVRDDDPLKRQAAITAASPYPIAERWRMLNSLLNDSRDSIRMEAARALAPILSEPGQGGLTEQQQRTLSEGLDAYRRAQMYQADRGFAHVNLGTLAQSLGQMPGAKAHYEKAISVEPIFIPAYVNLADLYRLEKNESAAQNVLKRALAVNDGAQVVHYALAMSYIRQGNKVQALEHLERAARDDPPNQPNSTYIYTYGLLLQDQGQLEQAARQLRRAFAISPNNPDISYTLAQVYLSLGNNKAALQAAHHLNTLVPGNPQIQGLLRHIQQLPMEP